jgi:alpha-mannosidase
MPTFKPHTRNQLDRILHEIEAAIYHPVADLEIRAWWSREPLPFAQRQTGKALRLKVGDPWGGLFDCAWFHFTGSVPARARGAHAVLLLDVSGEMCVFDRQGVPVQGLTNVSSTYDYNLGRPGKRVVEVSPRARSGAAIDVWADAGCNDLFGNLQDRGTIRQACVARCDDEARALFYDFEVLLDFLKVLPPDSPRFEQILAGLDDVAHLLCQGVSGAAGQARRRLAPLLAKRGGDPSLRISAVGHAHMDLAWLWPIRETIRKGARTFATALALMDRYPDYVFAASQAQYHLWMKEHYPALYARMRRRVAEGRLEPQGAMWVEADTNVSGGEALVRQVVMGKRFFRQEYGVEVRYLWLPDVFGYTASLPQILKRAGVDYFSTQKLSWSLVNTFPHHSFHWQGIDGSRVLSHMLPEETYNSPAAPRSVKRIERNYRDKGVSDRALLVFGIGDGGGGPGEEHLERLRRLENLEGLSPVRQEPTAAFFARWRKDRGRFPAWVGELYLERHQGTLTTQARNKRYNRQIELALRELEWTASLAGLLAGTPYPADRLEVLWREALLYQFHDILPGSSIKRVYDESRDRYARMLAEIQSLILRHDAILARQVNAAGFSRPVLIQNSLSWARTEWLEVAGEWVRARVPAMGCQVLDLASPDEAPAGLLAAPDSLENDLLRVRFARDGSIASILDKRCDREVLSRGQPANRLAVYPDLGDAWDFPLDYAEQAPRHLQLHASRAAVQGPRAVLTQVYRLGFSELTQEIALTQGSPRIDFINRLRWRETRAMLRTSFPVAVRADEASFEIQYGHLRRPTHRNTTWDLARDEVSGHKWVDLSQGDYGVALLNDCKYGHKVKGSVLDLDLLRSVPYPGPCLVRDDQVAPGEPHHGFTDQGDHEFTYSLFPHPGDLQAGGVVRAGYELNVPLRPVVIERAGKTGPRERSWLAVEDPGVVVEAVKKAEDSDDFVVRLYEAHGRGVRTLARFGFPVAAVWEVDLMEEKPRAVRTRDGQAALSFGPFEIKTLKVEARQSAH